MTAPLDEIRVVELANSPVDAQIGQMLADFGADVIVVEPPGGSPLRAHPSYPLWGRGKRCIELDLKNGDDLRFARELIDTADVLVENYRPGVAERLGLGYEKLSARNPWLVHASITGWGRQSPYADAPGYEGLVIAKVGAMMGYSGMLQRPGPAFVSVPYASWSAVQAALQGILAALYERERSGQGQYVESSLALAVAGLDPWNQTLTMIAQRYPEAFNATAAFDDDGAPSTSFALRLLVALTKDGRWLQFSQVQPRLFRALLVELGLDWMFDDPEWCTVPEFEDTAKRMEMLRRLHAAVRSKTLAEWQAIFDRNTNVFAEVFRRGTELLHHPQIEHDGLAVTVVDPERGATLQPAPMIVLDKKPARIASPAPQRNTDRATVRSWLRDQTPMPAGHPDRMRPALDGLTILELGTFYAGPYGATLMTDLGARVIKLEELGGDPMRVIASFPEAGAAKVLQGKESVAVDISTPEGREIALELSRRSDIVLRSFRAGVAERLGLDAESLLAVNPRLIYLDAPGFGVDGPCGHRPAFAPTISAGTGVAMRNYAQMASEEELTRLPLEDIWPDAARLTHAANSGGTQPDGIAALAVGTALTLAALMRARGGGGRRMMTTMVLSTAHAMSDMMIEYDGKTGQPIADDQAFGYDALYRIYETADGWVFLAAPSPRDWERLTAALAPYSALDADPRWSDPAGRREYGADLAAELVKVFSAKCAAAWEAELLAAGVGCVVCEDQTMEDSYLGEFGEAAGYIRQAESPIFDTYPRISPLVQMSRSKTCCLGGCTLGEHTDAVLTEIGYSAERIAELRQQGRIG